MPTGTVSEPATALGARLRDLRIANGYSQWQLAIRLDTQANRISNWETGRHEPTLSLLQRIAGVYEITVAEMLDGVM
jgi:XRE family transcriptional regulator, fatty acid utilization regulator